MVDTPRESGDERSDDDDRDAGGSWNERLFALLDELDNYGPSETALTVVRRIVALKPVEAAGFWLAKGSTPELTLSGWATADARHVSDTEREQLDQQARAFPVGTAADQNPLPGDQSAERLAIVARFPLYHNDDFLGLLGLRCRQWLPSEEFAGLQLLTRALGAQLSGRMRTDTSDQREPNPNSATHFIALIAHELRTPLTGLRGNVQLAGMALRKGDQERAETRLEAIIQAVDGITAFVQNLQDMSHLERGIFQIAVTPADLATSVRNAAKRAERLSVGERHSIEFEPSASVVTSHDPVRMEHAFFNLLVNALQYSIDGGAIHVQLKAVGGAAIVMITDPGIGISPDDQAHIFEPYFRGDDAKKISAKGLGLGLTICRATIERHGGRINIEHSDMSGTTMAVRLPLNAARVDG